MGIKSGVYFEEKQAAVAVGDIILLHTDGISDAENSSGVFFGIDRLCEVVREQSCNGPDQILSEVFQRLAKFTGDKSLTDDITIAIVKIVPS